MEDDDSRPTKLSFKFKCLFFILFMMQLVNSMDRGYVSANIDTLTRSLDLTGAQAGSLNSVFIAGMLISIPPMTYITKIVDRPFVLMSFGFSIWAGTTFIESYTRNYAELITCRVFVGIGEALFAIIAVPFVDYNAPITSRASIMAMYLCIYPTGLALGIIMAGAIPDWRIGFRVEAGLMVPLIIVGFLSNFRQNLFKKREKDCNVAGEKDENDEGIESPLLSQTSQWTELLKVAANPIMWLGCFGFSGLMGVTNGIGVWSITYAKIVYNKEKSEAAPVFGIITVLASIFGTVVGGKMLDYFGKKQGGKSCSLAFTFCGISSLIALPITVITFLMTDWNLFLLGFTFCGIFSVIAGANFSLATIWTVDVNQRVIVSSMSFIVMNLFGTVPIPIVIGILKGNDEDKFPRMAMEFLAIWLIWPTALSFICAFWAKKRRIGMNVDAE